MNISTRYSYFIPRQGSPAAGSSEQTARTAFAIPSPQGKTRTGDAGGQPPQEKPLLAQPLFKHRHGNTITLDDLKAEAQDAQTEFSAKFRQILAGAGIDASQPIVLRSDSQGQVHVANDHPHKAAIEKILHDNQELTSQYHRAEATASIAAAAGEASAFQQAYAINPAAAIAQYSYLFDNQKDVISMVV